MKTEEGRIFAEMCGCPVCVNEPHTAVIYWTNGNPYGHTEVSGRVFTTWGDWKWSNVHEKSYRERIVAGVEVEGVKIPASDFEAWGIHGLYTTGHVIIDLSPSDPLELPIEINPFM